MATRRTQWPGEAACGGTRDPDAFLIPLSTRTISDRIRVNEAKRLCRICSVRKECLEDALEDPAAMGIRGGLSKNGRTRLRRRRSQAAAQAAAQAARDVEGDASAV